MNYCDILELSLCDTIHDFHSRITETILNWYITDTTTIITDTGLCPNVSRFISDINRYKTRIESYCRTRYNLETAHDDVIRSGFINITPTIFITNTHFNPVGNKQYFLMSVLGSLYTNTRRSANTLDNLFLNILRTKSHGDGNIYITLDNSRIKNYMLYLSSIFENIFIINTNATICDRLSSICEPNIENYNNPITITKTADKTLFYIDKYEIGDPTISQLNSILCNRRTNTLVNNPNNIISYSFNNSRTVITKEFHRFIADKRGIDYGNQYYANVTQTRNTFRVSSAFENIVIIEKTAYDQFVTLITPIATIYNIPDRMINIRVMPGIINGRTLDPLPANNCYINLTKVNNLIKLLFDFKRLGDYSQIYTAKKYNYIFMTDDNIAAIFSYLLNVPCIMCKDDQEYPDYTRIIFLNFDYQLPSSRTTRRRYRGGYATKINENETRTRTGTRNKSKITLKDMFLKLLQKYEFSKINKFFNEFIIILFMFLAYDNNIITNDDIEYTTLEKTQLKNKCKEFIQKYHNKTNK